MPCGLYYLVHMTYMSYAYDSNCLQWANLHPDESGLDLADVPPPE